MAPPADRVAIVDDDPFVLAATSSLVRSFGWQACTFPSSEAFLASGVLGQVDCLVCDVRLTGMDGIGLLAQLRREGHAVPTVFITAFATDRVRERVAEEGALCLIEKPIDAEALETWISRALNR